MKRSQEFLDYCRLARGLKPRTLELYAAAIEDFAVTVDEDDPADVTARDLDQYLIRKAMHGDKTNTIRTRYFAVKAFFGYLRSRDFIERDPTVDVVPPRERHGEVPTFTQREVTRMIFETKPPLISRAERENDLAFQRRQRIADLRFSRDTAMLGLAYNLALRADEPGHIRPENFRVDGTGTHWLLVFGKHAKEPTRFRVNKQVAALIAAWRAMAPASDFLFPAVGPGARPVGIGSRQFQNVVRQRVELAGISRAHRKTSPHVLRYSRITHLYLATKDIMLCQTFARHASVVTTQRYIRLGTTSHVQKVADASLPWNRPPELT